MHHLLGTLAFLAVPFVVGAFLMFFGVRNAPEGYEDESGFNIVWCNNTPQTKNVVCIWRSLAEENAVTEVHQQHEVA